MTGREDPRWDEVRDFFVGMDGQRLTLREYADLWKDLPGRTLAEDVLPTGQVLRTVWSGLSDPFGGVLPFGSAVCPPGEAPGSIREVDSYGTREDALAGHARWLAELGVAEPST